jgi:serine-type D-Ala-D-Ala carboxypeptidase
LGRRSGIADFLSSRIEAGVFPGASYLVAENRRVLEAGAVGRAVLVPTRIPTHRGTIFDLASLTKPLCTAILALQLEAEGRLRLDDPLARHLPSWRGNAGRERVTLLDLLTHRSGLPAWSPLYAHARGRNDRVAWMRGLPLAHPAGREVLYSDLGYILAGFAIERAARAPLDRLFRGRVAGKLGRPEVGYRPPARKRRRIAATETGNERERTLAGAEGAGYNGWRTDVIWGEVHDHNAKTLGGVAGHAGLFGTAAGVHAIAAELLCGGHGVIPEEKRELLRTSFTRGFSEERSVGFQIASTRNSSAGPCLSPGSFGHNGFTGTSLWIDPESRRIYILLTNRVHPRFREINMNAVRRDFHEVAAAL